MVEWKKIEDFGSYFGGLSGKTKEDFVEGNAKFVTYMNVFSNPSLDIKSTGVVRINEGEKQNKIQKGDILFTGSSETPEEAGMSCVVTDDLNEDFYMNSFCFGIRLDKPEQYNLGFLKHILRSNNVRKDITKSASGVTRFNISKARFGKILIPIPSLEEQQRIVGILDTFTACIDNLKEQIAQRRKQYEHYRDELLDLEGKEGVEKKVLGSFGDVTKLAGFEFTEHVVYQESGHIIALRGLNVRDGHLDLSKVKYIDGSNFSKLVRSKLIKDDMLFTYVGTIGNVALIDENEKYYLAPNVSRIRFDKEIVNPKFALYCFLSDYFKRTQINKYLNSSSMKNLSMENIRKFELYLPKLAEQSRIVSILDTFEASIANLEAQLKEREKQYEYYRNKLLTFE